MTKIKRFCEYNDYDSIDADEEDYLYVGVSQIPNSGKGLFTSVPIEKDEIISKYIGEILSDDESQERADSGDDQYFMNLPSGEIFDCKFTKCFAKYANDAEGLPTKFKNNSFIAMDDEDNVVLVAKRNIKADEEIFTGYGRSYWKKHGL